VSPECTVHAAADSAADPVTAGSAWLARNALMAATTLPGSPIRTHGVGRQDLVDGPVDVEGAGAAAAGDRCEEDASVLLGLAGSALLLTEGSAACLLPLEVRLSVTMSSPTMMATSTTPAKVRAARRRARLSSDRSGRSGLTLAPIESSRRGRMHPYRSLGGPYS
jgi:hypothetical protein